MINASTKVQTVHSGSAWSILFADVRPRIRLMMSRGLETARASYVLKAEYLTEYLSLMMITKKLTIHHEG